MKINAWPLMLLAVGCGESASISDAVVANPDANKTCAMCDAAPDAPPPADLSCIGQPLPTAAAAMLTFKGTSSAITGLSLDATPGVLVEVFKRGIALPAAMTTTSSVANMIGEYSVTVDSGGVPFDGYLRGKKTGLLDFYLYPGAPVVKNNDSAPLLMLTADNVNTLKSLAGAADTVNPGFVGLALLDCKGDAVRGAVVNAPSGVLVRYSTGSSLPSSTGTATTGDGLAYLFNVPTGTLSITATANGKTLRTNTFDVVANSTATALIAP
jgi:hypothetical protein